MQTKVIAGLFGLVWTGVCYQAGRVSQRQKNQTFVTQNVQIEHPQPKGAIIPQKLQSTTSSSTQSTDNTPTTITQNPFTSGLIIPPYRTISYPNFKILYSTSHKCPLAVYEHVTKQIAHGDAPRRSTFFTQPSIQQQFQSTNDHFVKSGAYKNYYLARGHMAAAGNYSGNKQAKFQTFTYANVIPQNQFNNAGIWNTFERYSRDLVMSGKCDSVDIVSGPIYNKSQPFVESTSEKSNNNRQVIQSNNTTTYSNKFFKQQSLVLLQNGIVVPQKLYKIIQCNTKSNKHYIDAFQFWNKKTYDNQKPLKQFKTSISSIEKQTGLKFGFGEKDPLTGKLRLPQSLVEFDKQGFEKMKKSYDEKFYLTLMQRSSTINDMNNSFYRAKQQHIYIPIEQQLGTQINQLFNKEIKQIIQLKNKSKQQSACQLLSRLVKLNKDLFYLRQLKGQYEQQIKRVEDGGVVEECYKKVAVLRGKGWDQLNQQKQNKQTKQAVQQLKREKIALNSLTHALTKQQLKRQQIIKSTSLSSEQQKDRKMFHFVNQQQLNDKFIVPVNIQVSLNQQQQQ